MDKTEQDRLSTLSEQADARHHAWVQEDFRAQCAVAKEQGESMGKVTVFVNRVSHRFLSGPTTIGAMKASLRVWMIRRDGVELPNDEVVVLEGGESFTV